MGPHHGGIGRHRPVPGSFIASGPQRVHDHLPGPIGRPAAMPVIDRLPVPEPLRQIPPRAPRPGTEKDPIHHHADREHVIDMLKAAFVHGRVTKDEFDARVGQAFRVADLCGTGRSHRRDPRQADRRPAAGQPGPRAGPAGDEPCRQGPPMCGHCASHDDGGHVHPRWSRAPPIRATLPYGFDGCRCPDTRLTAREALPWSASGAQHLAQGGERPSAQRLPPTPTSSHRSTALRDTARAEHRPDSAADVALVRLSGRHL
jgi:hypothetical protein